MNDMSTPQGNPQGNTSPATGNDSIQSAPETPVPDTSPRAIWDDSPVAPVTPPVTPTAPVVATPPPTPTQTQQQQSMTPQQIAQLSAQAARDVMQQQTQQRQQQPRQYTQEELDRTLNVYRATPDTFQRIFGVTPENEQQVTALNDVLQSVVRQAVTMSKFLLEQQIGTVRQDITPIQQTVRAQLDQQLESEFYTVHPDLKDFRPLLVEIKDGMVARGMTFSSKDEAFRVVAEKARQLLAKTGQQPQGANQQPGQVQPTGTVPQMTPTTVGGRVGSPSATSAKTTAQSIFGS